MTSFVLDKKKQQEADEKARRERDEARAEVRRTYKELSESIAREAEAYERGAEAMREAAAACTEGPFVDVPERIIARRIRALPVPGATCKVCKRHDQPHDPCDCAGEGKK